MRKFLSVLILTSVLVLPFPLATAQRKATKPKAAPSVAAQRGIDTISAAQMHDYLSFIASDEMEGRDTPSRGLDLTAKFLSTNLARWGFKPAGDNDSYFQKIALRRDAIDKLRRRLSLESLDLRDRKVQPDSGAAAGRSRGRYPAVAEGCDAPATAVGEAV